MVARGLSGWKISACGIETPARIASMPQSAGGFRKVLTLFHFDEIDTDSWHFGDHGLSKCVGDARVRVSQHEIAIVIVHEKNLPQPAM